MKALFWKFMANRRVVIVTLVLGIACNCYVATIGTWYLRPIALFFALTMTHCVTVFMLSWREIDRNLASQAFFTKFVKPFMDHIVQQEADSDDDEVRKPTNVN